MTSILSNSNAARWSNLLCIATLPFCRIRISHILRQSVYNSQTPYSLYFRPALLPFKHLYTYIQSLLNYPLPCTWKLCVIQSNPMHETLPLSIHMRCFYSYLIPTEQSPPAPPNNHPFCYLLVADLIYLHNQNSRWIICISCNLIGMSSGHILWHRIWPDFLNSTFVSPNMTWWSC